MFNGDEGPAARIRSDDRGAWTGALTLAPGVRRSWFRAERTLGETLDGVADVALAVCSGNHEKALSLSKAEWDAGRLKSGRSDLPTAQTIRQRLRLSWPRTVELAFADPYARATVLAHWSGAKADALGANGPALAKRTLCAVALRLGHLPAQFEYDEVVRQMGAASRRLKNARRREFRRSTLERTIPLRLPSSAFLAATFGTWSAAVVASGAADLLPEITPTKPPSAADTSTISSTSTVSFPLRPTSRSGAAGWTYRCRTQSSGQKWFWRCGVAAVSVGCRRRPTEPFRVTVHRCPIL